MVDGMAMVSVPPPHCETGYWSDSEAVVAEGPQQEGGWRTGSRSASRPPIR